MKYKSWTPDQVLAEVAGDNSLTVWEFDSGSDGLDDVLIGSDLGEIKDELLSFHEYTEEDPFERGSNPWSLRVIAPWELLEDVDHTPENRVLAEQWLANMDMDLSELSDW